MFSKGNTSIYIYASYQITASNDGLVFQTTMLRKVQGRVIQRYDLNMRKRRASVTIRVRQSGHSRDEDMMRSEQLRHIAKWLPKKCIRQARRVKAKK